MVTPGQVNKEYMSFQLEGKEYRYRPTMKTSMIFEEIARIHEEEQVTFDTVSKFAECLRHGMQFYHTPEEIEHLIDTAPMAMLMEFMTGVAADF